MLVVHDTTECAFSHLSPKDIGFLQTGQAGFKLHPALVLDANEWPGPLGVIHAETVHREAQSKPHRKGKPSGSVTAKWADRESLRWWRGMSAAGKALANCKSVIHIADREGDSFALMANLMQAEQRFVIRVRVDRRARGSQDEAWSTVKQIVATCAGGIERDVPLSRRAAKATENMRWGASTAKGTARSPSVFCDANCDPKAEVPQRSHCHALGAEPRTR